MITFSTFSETKQVIVYAEAIRNEYYELLVHLDKCIPQIHKNEFIKAVNLWLE